MKRSSRFIKRRLVLVLMLLLSIESFAAVVGDNDGAAFITKAEFDSMKNDFQSQLDRYNSSLDNKIDGAIASYLEGIKVASKHLLVAPSSALDYPLTVYFNQRVEKLRDIPSAYKTNLENYWRPDWAVHGMVNVHIYFGTHDVTVDNKSNNVYNDFYNGKIVKVNGTNYYNVESIKSDVRIRNNLSTVLLQIGSTGYNSMWYKAADDTYHTALPPAGSGLSQIYVPMGTTAQFWMDCAKNGDKRGAFFEIPYRTSSCDVWQLPCFDLPWDNTNNYAPFQWAFDTVGSAAANYVPPASASVTTVTYPCQRLQIVGKHFLGGRDNPGVISWDSSMDAIDVKLNRVYAQAPDTNRFPVMYEGKVNVTNNKYKVQNLLPSWTKLQLWCDGTFNNSTRTSLAAIYCQHIIEPGIFIEPEGFSPITTRTWDKMSLISAKHIVYQVTTPNTNEKLYQGMTEGFFGTELEKEFDYGSIQLDLTFHGDDHKKYLLMANSPITFSGNPTTSDLSTYNLLDLSENTNFSTHKKYIELKSGMNDIKFFYNNSKKDDKIYYKIVTDNGSTDYIVIKTVPQLAYFAS